MRFTYVVASTTKHNFFFSRFRTLFLCMALCAVLVGMQGCKDPLEGDIPRDFDLINGTGWRKVSSLNLQHISDIVSFENTLIVVGDTGRIFRSSDNGRTWTRISHSLENHTFSVHNIGQKLFALEYFYSRQIGVNDRVTYQTDVSTLEWVKIPNPAAFPPSTPFELSVQGTRLFAIGRGSCSYSEDFGNSWTNIDLSKQVLLEVYGAAFIHNALFIGTNYGVRISQDTGKTWRRSDAGIDYTQNNGVAVNFTITPSTIIVNTSNSLFCSQDTGKTWQASEGWVVRGLLPLKFVRNMIQTPNFGLFSIAGSASIAEPIIYHSVNGGLSWAIVDSVNAPVNPNVLCFKNNMLFAGTQQNGLYRLPLR